MTVRVWRRALRGLSLAALTAAVALPFLPSVSSAVAPVETGWWNRDVPLQGGGDSDATVSGQSAGQRAVIASISSPSQVEPTIPPTTIPPTTIPPAPVPPPTVPPPPVTTPPPPVNLPPPSVVPDGGLYVANDSTGPAGVSALRFDDVEIGGAALTLKIAQGSTPAGPIVACPALAGWLPAENGPWDARPPHDCDRLSIGGNLDDTGTTMTWDIPNGFAPLGAESFDIVLVPLPDSGDVFQVAFEAPSAESLDVLSPPTPITAPPDTAFDPGFEIPEHSSDVGIPNDELGTFETSPLPEDTTTESADGSGVVDAGTSTLESVPVVRSLLEDRTARIVATLTLAAMGAWFFWMSNQPMRVPRLIGGLRGPADASPAPALASAGRPRGIGRFARPRNGPPERIV